MTVSSLDRDLLGRPPRHSVRVIAQARLQRVLEAAARVEVRIHPGGAPRRRGVVALPGAGPEAVHDLRVAIRRLRGWLRAFGPFLADTVSRGPERRLRRLSHLTGRVRDLEVQRLWLTEGLPGRARQAKEGARWLAGCLTPELARSRRALAAGLAAGLPRAGRKLAQQLNHYYQVDDRVMASAMARALRECLEVLPRTLERVKRPQQVAAAHAARIAIKHVRYLLEAFGPSSRLAAGAVRHLALLQQHFGELHDAQVLALRLSKETSRSTPNAAARRQPARRAVQLLRAALHRHVQMAFREVLRASRSPATAATITRVETLIRRLERQGARQVVPGKPL